MFRRFIGTVLCFLYGFALPLIAVVILALWKESRRELGMLKTTVRRATDELGIPANVELSILAPAAALALFVIIWFLAGKQTHRAMWMIIGLNSFAVLFVGLVVIGQ